MAGKPQNRLELRRQYEAAEDIDPMEADEAEVTPDEAEEVEAAGKKPKKRAKAPAKPKAKATKATKPAARMRIVWAVVNDAFKTIATFDYAQREAAEAKAAEMNARGKGTFFVQKTKEPMPEDAPGLGAVMPRTPPPPIATVIAPPDAADADDEDADDDEDDDADSDPEPDDED